MKAPFFSTDGQREARPQQRDYLIHLMREWNKHHIHAANLPTGYGKSFIARAIQTKLGADCTVVTVSNHLLDQFAETYPEVNAIKGRKHYPNVKAYRAAYDKARDTPCVANPMSYYFGCITGRINPPKVLVVDEAHKLYDTMFLAAHMDFDVKKLNIPQFKNTYDLAKWALDTKTMFETKLNQTHKLTEAKADQFFALYDRLALLCQMVESGTHTFTFDYAFARNRSGRAFKVLRISPTEIDKSLFWPFLTPKKVILMSGTLTRLDLKFYDRNADYYTGEYLSMPEHRRILYRPLPQDSRKCPETIAKKVRQVWEAEGKPNTVVHVTYDMASRISKWLPEAITHTKASKDKALKQFRTDGGILLASGMAEGVDLPDDECRLIIIPNLLYPNLGDEMVRKRRAMKEGAIRYALDTMMTTVQQIGRGTRHATDTCTSYVLDPNFSLLYQQTYNHLPNDLNIDWKAA